MVKYCNICNKKKKKIGIANKQRICIIYSISPDPLCSCSLGILGTPLSMESEGSFLLTLNKIYLILRKSDHSAKFLGFKYGYFVNFRDNKFKTSTPKSNGTPDSAEKSNYQ